MKITDMIIAQICELKGSPKVKNRLNIRFAPKTTRKAMPSFISIPLLSVLESLGLPWLPLSIRSRLPLKL